MQVQLTAITQPQVYNSTESTRPLSPEEYIIWCARISSPGNRENHETAPKLLRYLIDHKHWSPFEMVSVAFEITTSRAIAQQILRHRSFSFQEFSQRYAEATKLEPVELRYKAESNRQSSSDVADITNPAFGELHLLLDGAQQVYKQLLKLGIATETARMVLPLCTQTHLVMHGTVRSWIHFIEQRCDEHAQKEIRLIAERIRDDFIAQFPWLASAMEWVQESTRDEKLIMPTHYIRKEGGLWEEWTYGPTSFDELKTVLESARKHKHDTHAVAGVFVHALKFDDTFKNNPPYNNRWDVINGWNHD